MQKYKNTKIQKNKYKNTKYKIEKSRNTEIQKYENTKIQNTSIKVTLHHPAHLSPLTQSSSVQTSVALLLLLLLLAYLLTSSSKTGFQRLLQLLLFMASDGWSPPISLSLCLGIK